MKSILRALLIVAAVVVVVPAAQAQMQCYQCDPYASWCSESCWYCLVEHIDNEYCEQYNVAYSTCGEFMGACINCSPTWQETSRQNVGTYGSSWWHPFTWGCDHHRVDLVTDTDTSQCNENSAYWTRTTCEDWVDGWKSGPGYPDCCDGFCAPYVPCPEFSCNHYHSCY